VTLLSRLKANTFGLLNPTLRWFMLGMILANTAGVMVYTFLPVYLSELRATVEQIGMVYSMASLVPMVMQIFGGWMSDTIGRLRTIAIGSTISCFGYLGFWLAPSWEWVLISLGLEYISSAMVGPSYAAFVAEQSKEDQRGRIFGLTDSLFMIVTVVGGPLGGLLAGRLGYKSLYLVAMVFYLLASVLRVRMAIQVRRVTSSTGQPLSFSGLRTKLGMMVGLLVAGGLVTWIFITDGVRDIAYRLSSELQPLYLSQVGGLSVEQIGLIPSVSGLTMMALTALSGWLVDRVGERKVITVGFGLEFVAMVIFVSAVDFGGFALAAVALGGAWALMSPAYMSLITKAVPENLRGTAFGFFSSSIGVISLPAPWLGGQLWARFGPRIPFLVSAGAALLAIFPAWFKFHLPKKDPED
jgi:MFS family permease